MAFDAGKVTAEFEEFAYHGKPDENGEPVGLSDEEYDALVQRWRSHGEEPPWKRPSSVDYTVDEPTPEEES